MSTKEWIGRQHVIAGLSPAINCRRTFRYAARSCRSVFSDSVIFRGRTIRPMTMPAIRPNVISHGHERPAAWDEGIVPCWAKAGTDSALMIRKSLRICPFMVPPNVVRLFIEGADGLPNRELQSVEM